MDDTGIVRFPGNLDPRAQEFRPRIYHPIYNNFPPPITLLPPPPVPLPPPLYFPFPPPHMVPFTDSAATVIPYPHPPPPPPPQPLPQPQLFHTPPPAYVSEVPVLPPPSNNPTRTLVLTSVPGDVSETLVRMELEVFGDVRGVQMDRLGDGIVTVHFYDLRDAEQALREIREQHMQHQARLRHLFSALAHNNNNNNNSVCFEESYKFVVAPQPARGIIGGCAVWAQFAMPSFNAVPDGHNQGTVVVFNLDPNVTTSSLIQIFQEYGTVKEVRETPYKKQQRFVEFYDVRDAAKALNEMNGKDIYGRQVVIEFSRPGGYGRKFFSGGMSTAKTASSNRINRIISTKISRYSPPPPPPPPPSQVLPPPPPQPRNFSSSPSNVPPRGFFKGFKSGTTNTNVVDDGARDIGGKIGDLSITGGGGVGEMEKIGSDEYPKRSGCNNNGKKGQKSQSTSAGAVAAAGTTIKQQQNKNGGKGWKGGRIGKKFDTRFLINEAAIVESNCSDNRTTVMIKNIPNKYSQKLLLNMLDNHCIHCNEQIGDGEDQPLSSYDFLYLPIDFNNKCNVGYGFVNMTSPQAAWRLYKAFHHQHWEVFNSRKICEVTYARVQGLEALKEHFKNSKFPSEMDHHLPVVFSPPRDGGKHTDPLPIVCHIKPPTNQDEEQDQEDLMISTVVNSGGHDYYLLGNSSVDSLEDEDQENPPSTNSSSSQNGGDSDDRDNSSSSSS